MAAANNHKCQPVAEDGENKPAAAEQAPQDTPPECGKAARDPLSAGGSDLASQQNVSSKLLTAPDKKANSTSASSDHGDSPEALSAQNLRAHAAVVSSPSEDDIGSTVTFASLSESQPASSLSSCLAVPLSGTNLISADPAELPDRSQNQGLQDDSSGISQVSASRIPAGNATASAHSVRRDCSFVPRETPAHGHGPRRNFGFTASFKDTTAEKHSPSPANAAGTSNYRFAPAPGSQLQCRPDEHLGGAASFGIGMRERHDAAHMQTVNADIHRGNITISTLERELGISVRGEDGAISLRRAREARRWNSSCLACRQEFPEVSVKPCGHSILCRWCFLDPYFIDHSSPCPACYQESAGLVFTRSMRDFLIHRSNS